MPIQTLALRLASGRELEAISHTPAGEPLAAVLVAHCLPAGSPALAAIGRSFADRGCAVFSVDCALGAAALLQDALKPQELAEVAEQLCSRHDLPTVLVGHSWGGVLALAIAGDLPDCRAVVTINAPAGGGGFTKRASAGGGRVSIAGQTVVLPVAAAVEWPALQERVERLRRPLLVMHAPLDNTADIANAARIFTAAKHPKSFVSLDSADHMLARETEGLHAAEVICGWGHRYVRREAPPAEHHTRVVVAESGGGKYRQHVLAGRHRGLADEPVPAGGDDAGPSPYEMLLSALGACTSMTLRMYAEMKKLPLRHVSVELRHEKIHAAACQECETQEGKIDRIERIVTLEGDLTQEQRLRMLEIANKCPVHRTLHSEVWVPTRLADGAES